MFLKKGKLLRKMTLSITAVSFEFPVIPVLKQKLISIIVNRRMSITVPFTVGSLKRLNKSGSRPQWYWLVCVQLSNFEMSRSLYSLIKNNPFKNAWIQNDFQNDFLVGNPKVLFPKENKSF